MIALFLIIGGIIFILISLIPKILGFGRTLPKVSLINGKPIMVTFKEEADLHFVNHVL